MKKTYLISILSCLLIIFMMTSCSGYNKIMRNHLTNKENYGSYSAKICEIYYYDKDDNIISLLESDEIPESDIKIILTFEDYDTVEKFNGATPNPERSLNEFEFIFEITKENNQILIENGFYNNVTSGTQINISASSYIYMDTNFFFIAAISCNDTEYLTFEDGIDNIIKYVNDNKSLL